MKIYGDREYVLMYGLSGRRSWSVTLLVSFGDEWHSWLEIDRIEGWVLRPSKVRDVWYKTARALAARWDLDMDRLDDDFAGRN